MSSSSSSSSSSSKSHHHHAHHNTAGQSPTISVDEYLSRCFQAIDDLADNPYLNGTLQSPDDDGPVHMGRAPSSASASKQAASGHGDVDAQERVPLVASSSSKGESSGGAKGGLKRAFKRPSLFR